jgi:putative phosphoesterase
VDLLRRRGVELVLHCGDIEDAATVRLFEGLPAHFVFGNCDSDRDGLRRAMHETGAVCHEHWGHLELGGLVIAWTHGDDHRLLRDLEASGQFAYLFHGHTHLAARHQAGPTRVVNPGALHRARTKTFAVLDLSTDEMETVVVE